VRTTVAFPTHNIAITTIPKVGGSSIKAAVLKMRGVEINGEEVPHVHPLLGLCNSGEVPAKYRVYAFFRNTWERLASCYHQKVCTWRCERQGFSKLGCEQGMPFDGFVDVVAGNIRGNIHWRPQTDFTRGRKAGHLVIFDFKTLPDFWAELQKEIPELPGLAHYNRSDKKPYQEYYSDRSRRLVYELFQKEIDLMGFKF
jgi:hypothetical protein